MWDAVRATSSIVFADDFPGDLMKSWVASLVIMAVLRAGAGGGGTDGGNGHRDDERDAFAAELSEAIEEASAAAGFGTVIQSRL